MWNSRSGESTTLEYFDSADESAAGRYRPPGDELLTSDSLTIRDVFPQEADLLSRLELRSKAYWGYSKDFLNACRSELTVDKSRLGTDDYQCFAAVDGDSIVGFYTLERMSPGSYELEALFAEPEHIGRGVAKIESVRSRIAQYFDQ